MGANINFQDRSDGEIGRDKCGFMENSPYAMLKDENGNYTQDPLMYQYDRANETNWYFEKQYIQLEKGYTTLNTIFNAKVKLPFNITYQFNIAPRFSFFYDRYLRLQKDLIPILMTVEQIGNRPNVLIGL